MPSRDLVVPAAIVAQHRPDVVMLLRLGAGVNAMEASYRLMLRIGRTDNRQVTTLARSHCAFASIGYWRELVKMIQKEHYENRLWALVHRGVSCGLHRGEAILAARPLL